MWLLAGVRLLRAFRMSHRTVSLLHLPAACAASVLCWVVFVCVGLCVFLLFLCLVRCFVCAAGTFLILVAEVSR